MEWVMFNPQVHGMFASLGSHVGESFLVGPDCLSTLDEILKRLSIEDRTLRTFRRAIGFAQVIKKDLLPLLMNVRDNREITDRTIKILVNLTMPVECLLPIEVMSKTEAGRNTIHELNWLLNSCKEAFLDSRATRCIVEHVKHILDKGDKMCTEDSESLNNCILLLRNVLHIPGPNTTQNQILWNLFAHNIDKVLIEMMVSRCVSDWGVGMVQLIALLYKDQHVATLQKLLNLWFEASLSESSEDNESNTSPPERGSGDSSSSMVTSDPTSDSSDNGEKGEFGKGGGVGPSKESKKKQQAAPQQSPPQQQTGRQPLVGGGKQPGKQTQPLAQMKEVNAIQKHQSGGNHPRENLVKMECGFSSEVSDCGYGTQNQESVSTSSNEEDGPNRGKPVHMKPSNLMQKCRYQVPGGKSLTPQEKEDNRRKKLVKRSKTNRMNMKALVHHSPSEEDVSHLLKEFTVDFLLKGYGGLVSELRSQLTSARASLDTSHFFWLVTYFLKFATQLELDLEHIRSVLSFEVVSYLTFEGVNLCEQFEMGKAEAASDVTPCLRRMHLVVTAIRELVQAVDTYKKAQHLSREDLDHLEKLQRDICETEELRCLFLLLLRQFTPSLQSRQYLQDVIVTNHILLTFIETSSPPFFNDTLYNHLKQFVSVDVMRQYGLLLECFEENGQFVNDCIFTMMHHVAGDLERVSALFQPPILKTFSLIWESEFQICDDWSDLIRFVIHKFVNLPRTPTIVMAEEEPLQPPKPPPLQKPNPHSWSQEDCDSLYWYYVQSANASDPVGAIIRLYSESGITKTRIGVIEQLLEQDVITRSQYNELMEKEPILTVTKHAESQHVKKENLDEIEILKDHLVKEGKGSLLCWVQKALLGACRARMAKENGTKRLVEPVAYYCTLLEDPIPVVAWSCEQAAVMTHQPFALLLHKLGLQLPAGAGKAYARIPHFWAPSTLYNLASKIGPIHSDWLRFDPCDITDAPLETGIPMKVDEEMEPAGRPFSATPSHAPAYIPYMPEPNVGRDWLELARKSKLSVVQVAGDLDLSTMSVSDEESPIDRPRRPQCKCLNNF